MGLHIGNSYRPAKFDWMKSRGLRIRNRRKALGLNQADVAAEVGVDQSTVSDWEKRNAEPGAEQLMKLAKVLQTSAEELMLGKDERVWPFVRIEADRFLRLKDLDRGFVEGKLEEAIAKCEGPPEPDPLQVLERAKPSVRKVTPPRKGTRRA